MSLWGKLTSFFRSSSPAPEMVRTVAINTQQAMNAGYTNTENIRRNCDWLDEYRFTAALRTPLHRVCEDSSFVNWALYRERAKGTKRKVRSHEILTWWKMPSPGELGADFRMVTLLQLALTGNCFWAWEDPKDITSPCCVLSSHTLQELPKRGAPYYVFNVGGVATQYAPNEIVWLKRPNPRNPLGLGLGLGDAVGADLQQLDNMAKFNNQFFRQGAHLGTVMGIEGATNEAWDRFEESFKQDHAGVGNAFKNRFITGKVTGLQMAAKHRDLDYVQGFEQKRAAVRQAVGTPAEIVGDSKDSNKATSYEAGNLHQTYGMWPKLQHLYLVVNDIVLPKFGYGDQFQLAFENPIRQKEELLAAKMEAGFSRGAATMDEYRRFLDLEPKDGGDRHFVPPNTCPVLGSDLDKPRDSLLQRKGNAPSSNPDTAPVTAGGKSILDKYLGGAFSANDKSV